MIQLNGNKNKWTKFDIALWDADIDIFEVNKNPVNNSNVIFTGVHFCIQDKHLPKFKKLAKRHDFEFEFRK